MQFLCGLRPNIPWSTCCEAAARLRLLLRGGCAAAAAAAAPAAAAAAGGCCCCRRLLLLPAAAAAAALPRSGALRRPSPSCRSANGQSQGPRRHSNSARPTGASSGASQCSLHNAPIFRLLLKVAVNGTHQCESTNFCGASSLNLASEPLGPSRSGGLPPARPGGAKAHASARGAGAPRRARALQPRRSRGPLVPLRARALRVNSPTGPTKASPHDARRCTPLTFAPATLQTYLAGAGRRSSSSLS